MSMPKKIFAYRWHEDNQENRARGAWDDRLSEVLKSDTLYVRSDEYDRLAAALVKIIDLGGAYGSRDYAERADKIARTALRLGSQ